VSSILKRTAAGALVALTLGLTFVVTPASAQGWYGHRYGGWGYHNGGWGGPVAAGVIGGLAVGALAAGAANAYYPPAYPGYPAYGPAYGPVYGGGCYIQRQPVFGPYGQFLGYHRVRMCD
jgi:hypothetical protein